MSSRRGEGTGARWSASSKRRARGEGNELKRAPAAPPARARGSASTCLFGLAMSLSLSLSPARSRARAQPLKVCLSRADAREKLQGKQMRVPASLAQLGTSSRVKLLESFEDRARRARAHCAVS